MAPANRDAIFEEFSDIFTCILGQLRDDKLTHVHQIANQFTLKEIARKILMHNILLEFMSESEKMDTADEICYNIIAYSYTSDNCTFLYNLVNATLVTFAKVGLDGKAQMNKVFANNDLIQVARDREIEILVFDKLQTLVKHVVKAKNYCRYVGLYCLAHFCKPDCKAKYNLSLKLLFLLSNEDVAKANLYSDKSMHQLMSLMQTLAQQFELKETDQCCKSFVHIVIVYLALLLRHDQHETDVWAFWRSIRDIVEKDLSNNCQDMLRMCDSETFVVASIMKTHDPNQILPCKEYILGIADSFSSCVNEKVPNSLIPRMLAQLGMLSIMTAFVVGTHFNEVKILPWKSKQSKEEEKEKNIRPETRLFIWKCCLCVRDCEDTLVASLAKDKQYFELENQMIKCMDESEKSPLCWRMRNVIKYLLAYLVTMWEKRPEDCGRLTTLARQFIEEQRPNLITKQNKVDTQLLNVARITQPDVKSLSHVLQQRLEKYKNSAEANLKEMKLTESQGEEIVQNQRFGLLCLELALRTRLQMYRSCINMGFFMFDSKIFRILEDLMNGEFKESNSMFSQCLSLLSDNEEINFVVFCELISWIKLYLIKRIRDKDEFQQVYTILRNVLNTVPLKNATKLHNFLQAGKEIKAKQFFHKIISKFEKPERPDKLSTSNKIALVTDQIEALTLVHVILFNELPVC
ncbi:hypothetical protein Ciccas_003778 [Cichlidogyrus casuarinus]|uniref:Uncharacterized protein n=1 Tax=Cichlidogyrus casuarinus TaxID=1844966 RepID=A0ABD2QDF2_9PLAT